MVEQEKAIVKKPDNLSLGLWNSSRNPSSAEHVCNLSIPNYRKTGGRERISVEAHRPPGWATQSSK